MPHRPLLRLRGQLGIIKVRGRFIQSVWRRPIGPAITATATEAIAAVVAPRRSLR